MTRRDDRFAELRSLATDLKVFNESAARAQAHLEQCIIEDCGIFLVHNCLIELRWTSKAVVVNATFDIGYTNIYVFDRDTERLVYDINSPYPVEE